jgi:FAD:protein FMN transferase
MALLVTFYDNLTMKRASTTFLTRRQFLQITAVTGGLLAAGYGLGKQAHHAKTAVWRESRYLMGTFINLTLVSASEAHSRAAVQATFAEMARLVALFDHRQPDSPLARLNRDGTLPAAPPELVETISLALRYGDLSGGAFDISMKPLLDQARQATDPSRLDRSLVDYRQIVVNGRSITLTQAGMAVTLDGIAKGRVVDGAVAHLGAAGFANVLVEAGGDLVGNGRRADGRPWQVGITHPRQPETAVFQLAITDQSVASSGDYQHTFTNDFRHHHIIDPHRGQSPTELASVTVTAPTTTDADALSTALMVMGTADGLALIERLPHVEALLVTKTLDIYQSSGFNHAVGSG